MSGIELSSKTSSSKLVVFDVPVLLVRALPSSLADVPWSPPNSDSDGAVHIDSNPLAYLGDDLVSQRSGPSVRLFRPAMARVEVLV